MEPTDQLDAPNRRLPESRVSPKPRIPNAIESSWERLQLPRDGDARIGKIGAVGAGANGPFKMCAQRRMLGTDTPHGLSDRARHTGSGALCRGADASIASSESHRAGQLAREEVAFGSCLRHP